MEITCEICNLTLKSSREFGYHLFSHNIKVEDYIIKYKYNGVRPVCLECDSETRYVSSEKIFKDYCKEHAKLAMKKGGKKGGKAEAWNKGKTKKNDERIKKQAESVTGSGNHFYGKSHSEETKNKIKKIKTITEKEYEERIFNRKDEFLVLTPYSDYSSRQNQYLEFKCVKCNFRQEKTLQAFERGSLCPKCFPFTTSQAQVEILSFVSNLGFDVQSSVRNIISPLELDIHIPDKKFAIEYNSLYYHKDRGDSGFNKSYHKTKTSMCKDKNIRLMHIFGDEWRDKKELVQSMIKNRLGIFDQKIGARECDFREIETKEAKDFFDKNHIDGYSKSCAKFGLYHKDELVFAITLREPTHKKHKGKIEICRLATKQNCIVMGGFRKLLKKCIEWMKVNQFSTIMTYADLRFGEGNVYRDNGFDFIGDTGLNFWYTDDTVRFNRFKFRAKDGKSEKEVAKDNKVFRIYGCGNYLYEMKI